MSVQLSQELIGWLYDVVTPEYHDPDRTYNDSVKVLSDYPSLRPRTDVFTSPDGKSELLLCLYGTIPAVYLRSIYRIPIEIWIPKSYPYTPPTPIIRPTEAMVLKPNNYVDQSGVCFHPYLYGWNESSTLIHLVAILVEAFSKSPPVYAKPPVYQREPTQSPGVSGPGTSYSNYQSPPPPPPQTQQLSSPPPPSPHNPVPNSPQSHQIQPQSSVTTPPLPPKPPKYAYSEDSAPVPVRPQPHHAPQQQPPPQQLMDMDPGGPSNNSEQEAEEEKPARPPNPEKLQAIENLEAQLNYIINNVLGAESAQDDQAIQYAEQTLTWMEAQLENQNTEFQRLDQACYDNETILTEKIDQAKRVISEAKTRQKPNIDEILCAENVVYNQLYDLVAEDHAIEDTVYVLGRALDKDRIQLDPFLKHTRTLAREQFLKKALVKKISNQIGLD